MDEVDEPRSHSACATCRSACKDSPMPRSGWMKATLRGRRSPMSIGRRLGLGGKGEGGRRGRRGGSWSPREGSELHEGCTPVGRAKCTSAATERDRNREELCLLRCSREE